MRKINFIKKILTDRRSIVIHVIFALLGTISLYTVEINQIYFRHHLVFILVVCAYIAVLALYFHLSRILKIALFCIYTIFLTECFLYITVSNMLGDLSGRYTSLYQTNNQNFYFRHAPNESYYLEKSEFSFPRTSNSYGFSDKEWSLEKDSGQIRILVLGDSFTEGDGTDTDSTYPRFLERSLKHKYTNIEFMNAGICGSDPFFNFKVLEDVLISLKPNIILQSFITNDLYQDIAVRGGMERFQPDSTFQFRFNHKWERLYALSYIFRIGMKVVGGYNSFLIRNKEYSEVLEDCNQKTIQLFKEYKNFADKNKIELIVFTFPFINDLTVSNKNLLFHDRMNHEFSKFSLNFYNLQPCYEEYISEHRSSYKDYYWRKDGHHNTKGYEMMAECLKTIIESNL